MHPRDATLIEVHNSTRHDSAVAMFHRGDIYALAAERADRIKHSADPTRAYEHLVRAVVSGGVPQTAHDHFDAHYTPHGSIHHHLGHAASTFYSSPFSEAAVLIVDGMGPFESGTTASTSLWHGTGTELKLLRVLAQPGICYRSLGHFYAAVSYYLGFPFFDVSHTMSIAAYGDPTRYRRAMERLIWATEDGLYDTDWEFIRFATHVRFGADFGWAGDPQLGGWRARYAQLLGPMRAPSEEVERRHCDIAAAAQVQLEAVLRKLLTLLYNQTGTPRLCYGGGVALNCVANGRALFSGPFDQVFIQPAAGDDGQALGRLLFRLHHDLGAPRRWTLKDAFLGPPYSNRALHGAISANDRFLVAARPDRHRLAAEVAANIAEGQIIAWFQGRSEYGPRALGHRSILADPRDPETPGRIARRFKARAWYRPFAPSVLASGVADYFEPGPASPFMLTTLLARPGVREVVPAVVHTDGSARVQAVPEDGSRYHRLIAAFARATGVPMLLNTSFNLAGEPIVETPEDAIDTFLRSDLDALVLGPWIIRKRRSS